ncbi:MAG: NAD(P)H-dependent oxidoreductase [Saprospiraceae bacterium]|nr:NAD(P)H-dependent oxidoreductase [Saprospiraceae bacterium]
MPKKILIIDGHPDEQSYCTALCKAYRKGAIKAGAIIEEIIIRDLDFKLNLQYGYRKRTELEPCLVDAQRKFFEADHIVWIHPVWWGSYPAIMKGFIDRVFLPRFFFKKIPGKSTTWEKLLTNKSAHIIYTLDTPKIFWWLAGRPSFLALKYTTLFYCGVSPIRGTALGIIRLSSEKKRKKWLNKVEKLGEKLK